MLGEMYSVDEFIKSKEIDLSKIYFPTCENLDKYFDYLNKNTFLTKKFVTKNWNKIILIDSSSGQSIHGVSVFFNIYVGNIKYNEHIANHAYKLNILNAQPLQFINLTYSDTKIARNFNSKLILNISEITFFYCDAFKILELFPRFVPFYHIRIWNKPPEFIYNRETKSFIKTLEFLLKSLQKSLTQNQQIYNKIKLLVKNIKGIDKYMSSDVLQTFRNINTIVNLNKCACFVSA